MWGRSTKQRRAALRRRASLSRPFHLDASMWPFWRAAMQPPMTSDRIQALMLAAWEKLRREEAH